MMTTEQKQRQREQQAKRQQNKTPEQKRHDADRMAERRRKDPAKYKAISDRYQAKNKERIRLRQRAAHEANPERERAKDRHRYHYIRGEKQREDLRRRYATEEGYKQGVLERNLGKKYGLDWDGWNELYIGQDGKCLGCLESLARAGEGVGLTSITVIRPTSCADYSVRGAIGRWAALGTASLRWNASSVIYAVAHPSAGSSMVTKVRR